MFSSSDSFITKLPLNSTNRQFILKSAWASEEVNLELVNLEDNDEMKGKISIDDLKESAKALEIPFDDFYSTTQKAFCTNGGLTDFEYAIESHIFILRKIHPFREIYCKVPVVNEPGLLEQIIFDSVDSIDAMKNELKAKQSAYQFLDMEFKMLAQSYERSVQEKEANETELLKKCAVLLNSKKNKIAELLELISEGSRLAAENRSRSPGEMRENGDEELTQPMAFTETQRPVRALPKRKNLVAAEAAEKRLRPTEIHAEGRIERVPPGENSDVESALNSEEMFDAM